MESEENKLLIISYLEQNKPLKFSVKKLYDNMKEKYPNVVNVSYVTFLRFIDVLISEKKIDSEDFQFVRFVWSL